MFGLYTTTKIILDNDTKYLFKSQKLWAKV